MEQTGFHLNPAVYNGSGVDTPLGLLQSSPAKPSVAVATNSTPGDKETQRMGKNGNGSALKDSTEEEQFTETPRHA